MQVSISQQNSRNLFFGAKKNDGEQRITKSPSNAQKTQYSNPINSGMEYLTAIKMTLIASLAVTGRIAIELMEGSTLTDILNKENANKVVDKLGKNAKTFSPAVKMGLLLTGMVALTSALAFVVLLPKALYKTKVETFKKKAEMDSYVRTNSAEKNLVERIVNEAKVADQAKKAELMKNLMTLEMSKNNVPYFVDKRKVTPQLQ